MKRALMIVGSLTLAGCASLPFGGFTDQIATVLKAQVAGKYTVQFIKDGNVIASESWECVIQEAGGKLDCHKVAKP